jgi:hypothetical protein
MLRQEEIKSKQIFYSAYSECSIKETFTDQICLIENTIDLTFTLIIPCSRILITHLLVCKKAINYEKQLGNSSLNVSELILKRF